MIIKVDKEDIKKIESLKQTNFTQYDENIKSQVLKQENARCIFLKKEGDEFVCSIYEHRPKVCRQYPFINKSKVEDCRPPRWEYWPKINSLFKL